jgi:sensor c-di-GMP phosphodiesterase-like protein
MNMDNILQKISLILYQQLKIIWTLFTILVLIIALGLNWQMSYNRSHKKIEEIATQLSNNVDGFIEDLFQEVYTLPLYGKKLLNCAAGLSADLEHITLNNPRISGLLISDSHHQLICSTLKENQIFTSSINARAILGPYSSSLFDQPIYLVQQKIGNYYIGVLIVASVLKSIMHTSSDDVSSVALRHEIDKKNIINVQYNNEQNRWLLPEKIGISHSLKSHELFVKDKLQSIEGVSLLVFENKKTVVLHLWFSETATALFILLSSYILYFLIKHSINKRYSLHGAMKAGIKNKEFYPEYQLLYDRKNEAYSGAEILLRWQDKEDKIIMPDFFIEEAETTGLIVPITLQIMEIAFKETEQILINNPDFHLSFNLSALHFKDPTFFNKFDVLAQHYKIAPKQILFEITERDLLDKNDTVFITKMQELRNQGYSLAVDDYGTGHASISYLHYFPFDYLKIDKLFIQAIGTKAITESLNDAIIQMAKELNLIIIAEGVETQEQVDYLSANGVRFLQGWYFAKATSIEKILDLLQGKKYESNS